MIIIKNNALLRLLLACFFLYVAWPSIPEATTQLGTVFWGMWLVFFMLVAGANLALMMKLDTTAKLEQMETRRRKVENH